VASVAERLRRAVARDAPSWGIRPVPPERRVLGGIDLAVLWGDLSVGLLVMVTGALLVPAMGLRTALLAIAVGSALGSIPLALVARAGEREGVPTMVLLRPVLGARGSIVPSALNLVQLVGWTAVEFWAMGAVANVASRELIGFDARALWVVAVAVVCTALALGGPCCSCGDGSSASASTSCSSRPPGSEFAHSGPATSRRCGAPAARAGSRSGSASTSSP
jgi:NCS1 family nucleobase:cation symporter-1